MTSRPFLILFLFFLALRLYFITTFPPYTDESLYIRWGQIMVSQPSLRFASLAYISRQPLGFWLFGAGSLLFHHPLWGARLIVLLANIPTVFLLVWWFRKLYSSRTAVIGLAILTFCPVFILFQSLALMEGFLFPLTLTLLICLHQYIQQKRTFFLLATSVLIGISLWIKSTAIIFLVVTEFFLLWEILSSSTFRKIPYLLLPLIISGVLLFPLFMQPDVHTLLVEHTTFTFSPRELIAIPINMWLKNITYVLYALFFYLTPLGFAGMIIGTKYKRNNLRFFLLLVLMSAFWVILLGKIIRLRYFVMSIAALLPILTLGTERLLCEMPLRYKKYSTPLGLLLPISALLFILTPPTFFSLFPKNSFLETEREYAFSWTSGYGIPELIAFINQNRSSSEPLILAVPDTPGNPTDYILAYYYHSQSVKVVFVDTSTPTGFKKVQHFASTTPLYLVTRGSLLHPDMNRFLKEVKIFTKPNNEDFVGIYQILP